MMSTMEEIIILVLVVVISATLIILSVLFYVEKSMCGDNAMRHDASKDGCAGFLDLRLLYL